MFGGSSLVLGPDKSHGSALLVVEVRQPGDDAEEDDGEDGGLSLSRELTEPELNFEILSFTDSTGFTSS